MYLQIASLVLWPRTIARQPRVVPFELGCVNVITGASKTGKSAIIPIIDYCLGSEKCAIPVETIRNQTSWFGVLLQTPRGQLLLARREPGVQKSTSDMYFLEGERIEIPQSIKAKNTSVEAVKHLLDELAGLTRLNFDFDGLGSGFKGRPSFRDLMAFLFQPQNIIANPDVFFYKADTFEHREKLRTIFPYVLGAVTPKVLAAQHELETVRRELARKERELAGAQKISERWIADLRGWVSRGKELGLIVEDVRTDGPREQLVSILRQTLLRRPDLATGAAQVDAAVQELNSLLAEDSRVASQLAVLRRRYSEMERLRESAESYGGALRIQRERLAVAPWLRKLTHETGECPVCTKPMEDRAPLDELCTALELVEREAVSVKEIPASFERELLRVKDDIAKATEQLKAIGIRITALQGASKAASDRKFRNDAASHYLGGLEQALLMHDAVESSGELSREVGELRERQSALQEVVSAAGTKARLTRAIERLGAYTSRLLPALDTERPDDPVELSITDLTVRVKGAERVDYLWEIGSGANWLSYHVAVSLGLQWLFKASEASAVPGLLVYDQPSQVYFPRRAASRRMTNSEEELDPRLNDEDTEAVRKVFETMAMVVNELQGRLQIIVLDHAGPGIWGDIVGVHLVEEWRLGLKLVPEAWILGPEPLPSE